MEVKVLRNGRKIEYEVDKEISVFSVMEKENYEYINPLDIENYKKIKWEGIEFNNLFAKDGILYRFNKWLGTFPYRSLEIEEIGIIQYWYQ